MNTTPAPITSDHEIINHGVATSSYFQGCGVSYTAFEHVQTGIGDTEKEALDDALEQIATSGVNISPELEQEAAGADETIFAYDASEGDEEDDSFETPTFFVSVRYNTRTP